MLSPIIRFIRRWQRYGHDVQVLSSFSDLELADIGINRDSEASGDYREFANLDRDECEEGPNGPNFREKAMNNKLMFVALGYALLLAALDFALDAGIADMVVHSD